MDKGDEEQLINTNNEDNNKTIFYYILDEFMTWIDRATGLDIDRVCSAAEKGDIYDFKKQIKIFKTDINKRGSDGLPPLHLAIINGHNAIVKEMLTLPNIEVNILDKKYRTALHIATINNSIFIVQLLLHYGVNVNSVNLDNRTPLHEAVFLGHEEICKLLIDAGAYINAIDCQGLTPLHLAAQRNLKSIALILLHVGADQSIKSISGNTWDTCSNPSFVNELKSIVQGQENK